MIINTTVTYLTFNREGMLYSSLNLAYLVFENEIKMLKKEDILYGRCLSLIVLKHSTKVPF